MDVNELKTKGLKQLNVTLDATEELLDTYVWSKPQLKPFKAKIPSNVRPAYIGLGAVALIVLVFLFTLGWDGISNILCFSYPAYKSLIALETDDKADDTQWLTYWVVFSTFNLIESVTDLLFNWIPLYYLVKTGVMIWLMHPTFKGASTVYTLLLKPFVVNKLNIGKAAAPPAAEAPAPPNTKLD